MKKAFYYMFKDAEFFKKTYIILLFIFVSSIVSNFSNILHEFIPVLNAHWQDSMYDPIWNWVYILLTFVSLALMFIPSGYFLSIIKSLSKQEDNYILENMDIKRNFIQGLKLAVGVGLIYILFVIVASLFLTASVIIALAFANQVMFYLTIAMITVVLLIFFFYAPIFNYMFAYKSNLLTYFRYMMATKIFLLDKKQYFKGIAIIFALCAIWAIVSGLLSSVIVLRNPILFVISTAITSCVVYYFILVSAFITAKALKLEALDIIFKKD